MKMDWKYFVIILLSYVTRTQAIENLTCITEETPRIRTFKTLVQYQENQRSFDPHEKDYEGNYVRFSFDCIDRLPRNVFITLSSTSIVGMDLSNKSIRTIDEGAFLYLSCLQHLDLSNNRISDLSKDMFSSLTNLKTLNISRNNLSYVYDNVFSNLQSIQILDMSYNNISELDKSALSNMPTLEKLILSFNCMKRIRYPYFSQLKNLRELYLDHNEIALMPTIIFNQNMILEKLDLSANGLVLLDMRNDHSELQSIKQLNLSDNYLITLQVEKIACHFPNDDLIIDFNNNQFYCSSWQQYLQEFKEKHIKIAPGRNFSQEYYIDGIACDTLNSSLNGTDTEEEDTYELNAKLGEDNKRYEARLNSTVGYILRELNHKEGELSGKRAKYKNAGDASDKSSLVEHGNVTATSEKVNSESDSHVLRGFIIVLGVIGAAFLILVSLDYVLGVGYTQTVTRRLRRYLASSSSDDTSEYVTLTPSM